jgi:hypothetical protein
MSLPLQSHPAATRYVRAFLCGLSSLGALLIAVAAWRVTAAQALDSRPVQLFGTVGLNHPLKASIGPGESQLWETPDLQPGELYSVSITLDTPSQLTPAVELVPRRIASPITFNVDPQGIYSPEARVEVRFESAGNPAISKKLHAGDPGAYLLVRAAQQEKGRLELRAPSFGEASGPRIHYQLELRSLQVSAADSYQIAPNTAGDPLHASPMELGKTVFGTSDDIEYLYNTDEGKVGWQWLTFEYGEPRPKLVFFELDLIDRDVPCTLKIYRQDRSAQGLRLAEYTNGKDPTEIRHDDQADELVGFKFVTRVLTPGRYYVAVKANHPYWSLRTALFDVPPYRDPRQAVEVAMRYMVDVGDSFFSNTPRKGAVRTRAENVTDETERCITCHPAHFTMLSTLTAVRNGYTVRNHPQFKFMMDKLYNAPAPFYGFPNTYWLRFELAPTNGISRLGTMLLLYENLVSHRPTETPGHLVNYPRLVYDARDVLPRADTAHYLERFQPTKTRNYEFDGNRPISDFRVATDSWFLLNEVAQRARAAAGSGAKAADTSAGVGGLGAGELQKSADHLQRLMTSTSTNDLEDIVEQTKGMVMMGDPRFRPIIQANIRKILDRQHNDGGWVTAEYMSNEQFFDAAARAPFEKKSDPSLQFMTGEVLYTLKLAGYDMEDPRVQKAIHWLLGLQREFGGWLDNKGELFLQPHLETSWAVMGLSQIYPQHGPALAPAPPAPRASSPSLVATLNWLDQLWYVRDSAVLGRVLPLLNNPEPLVRQAAAAAVGRMAVDAPDPALFQPAVAPLTRLLGDRVKMVSRAAAWSLRQLGNDGLGGAIEAVKQALESPDDYTRRGAARVFYQYAYHMTGRDDVARALVRHVNDSDLVVRIESLKALWRWWYRTPDMDLRREIEQAFLSRAAADREHPLVRLNVAQALYNILDDNTVQFHRNWLRSMALQSDRERAEAARIAEVERPLARELAAALSSENPSARETVLTALDYYFLRGGIGNDYDSITFYDPQAAETLARAILPLINSPDAVVADKALAAAAVAREARDRELLLAVMRHLSSNDKHTREVAEQELSRFPAQYSPLPDAETKAAAVGGRP